MIRGTIHKEENQKVYFFRTPLFLVKLFNYEYWPFWILFFPSILYGLFLALKARSLTYFTAANPGIELGGFFGESKINILDKIETNYLPATNFYQSGTPEDEILSNLEVNKISFPLICKPDKGERGFQVEKIDNATQFKNYINKFKGDLIIQEYIDYEMELGILYFRMPDGSKSGITSVVVKEYLSVTGNGLNTLHELILKSNRARFQKNSLRIKFEKRWNEVIDEGGNIILERIGNHCRGTKFLNGNKLINRNLVEVFDKIAGSMTGFYFGRFDLKVKSIEDLYAGRNIRVMEVNGTTSEPAHIYDPKMSFWEAQKSIFHHTKLVYEIALQNHHAGVPYTPFKEALKTILTHFREKEKYAD